MEMVTEAQSQWYLTFISIIFGVFIAVWIVPIARQYREPDDADDRDIQEGLRRTLKTLSSASSGRAGLMFIMLICLWWWYGTFLGNISPAVGFWTYMYDFISLCSFAIAFRMCDHRWLFPMVVFFAAGLMLLRFGFAYQGIVSGSDAEKAMLAAIAALGLFILVAVSALVGSFSTYRAAAAENGASADVTYFRSLGRIWSWIEKGVVGLLIVGIIATFFAVYTTEGAPFGDVRDPSAWTGKGNKIADGVK